MSPDIRRMIKPVLAVYGATSDIILEQNDKGNIYKASVVSRPRNVAMYVVRKRTSLSFPDIAREFGVKNHTTVMLACRKVESDQKLLAVANGFVERKDVVEMADPDFDRAQASYEESMQSGEEPSYSSADKEAKEQWEADQYEDENR